MIEWVPIVLLFASLALFLLSTLQLKLSWRLAFIVGAAALLVGSVVQLLRANDYGLLGAIGDVWSHRDEPRDSVIGVALSRNEIVIDRHLAPVLDVIAVIAGLIGLLSLIALTPGKNVERAVRMLIVLSVGAMGGAALAFSLVALGMGGPVKQRVYVGTISASDVHDGDTIWLGDVSLRLAGVDAPELRQPCEDGYACGELAKDHLVNLVRDQLVECQTPSPSLRGPPRESFGRPILRCVFRSGSHNDEDVAALMIQDGFAVPYRDVHAYDAQLRQGCNHGLLARRMLRPEYWRNHAWRVAYEGHHIEQLPTGAIVGACYA